MNSFPPPAQGKKPRGLQQDPPRTWGSSREQTMPKVASKLSLSQSPTAWMQPRTWMILSSSRRWKNREKHHWDVGLGGDVISCVCSFLQARGVAREVFGNWFLELDLSLGFLDKKLSLGATQQIHRDAAALCYNSLVVISEGLKMSFSPTTKLQTQLRTSISWSWPRKATIQTWHELACALQAWAVPWVAREKQ